MSIKVMSWVWEHSQAKGAELLVLLAIADHCADDGTNAWPSQATLARRARVTSRSVQRALGALVEAGELAVELHAGGTHFTDSRYRPNRYTVVMDEGRHSVGSNESRGDTGDVKGRHLRHPGSTPASYESSLDPSGTVRASRGDVGVGSECAVCEDIGWTFDERGDAVACRQCASPKLRALQGGA